MIADKYQTFEVHKTYFQWAINNVSNLLQERIYSTINVEKSCYLKLLPHGVALSRQPGNLNCGRKEF